MSIQSEIERLENAKQDISDAIEEKGVDVPNGASMSDMAGLVRSIPQNSGSSTVIFQTEVEDGVLKVYQDENDALRLYLNDGILIADFEGVTKEIGAVSAYAIAVEHGYQGTEEQWLESLDGTKHILTQSDKAEIAQEVTDGLSFKTINNESIFGEGNIAIEGGAGESRDEVEFIKTIEISESDVASITVDLENYYKKVFITNSEFEVYDNIESSIVTALGVKIWLKKDGNSIFNFSYNFVLNTGIAPVPRRGYNITIDLSPPLLRFYVEQYMWSGGLNPSSGNGNSKVTILSNSLRDCFDTVELQTIGDGRFVQNAKLHFWGVKK